MKKINFESIETPSNGVKYNDRVLLVDGLNHFIRCFSVNPMVNDDGVHIGGIYGFINSLMSIVELMRPTRIVICFDGKNGSTLRRKIYPEYKANRKIKYTLNRTLGFKTPEDEERAMKEQFQRLYEYLLLLPITITIIDEVEADDIIAYLVKYFQNEKIIVSTDKDYIQLIDEKTRVYSPSKKELLTSESVLDKYSVSSENFIYYKVLMGDSSDNIPGISGVGEMTIKKIFRFLRKKERFEVSEFLQEISKYTDLKSYKILEQKEDVFRNYELMQLHEPIINNRVKLMVNDIMEQPLVDFNLYLIRKLFNEDKLASDVIVRRRDIFTQLFSLYQIQANEK